jgi:hypothetical protein
MPNITLTCSRSSLSLSSYHVYGCSQVALDQRTRQVQSLLRPPELVCHTSHLSPECRLSRNAPAPPHCTICARCSTQRCLPPLPLPPAKGPREPRNRRTKAVRPSSRSSTKRMVVGGHNGRSRPCSSQQCCRARYQCSQHTRARPSRASLKRTKD